MGCHRVTQACQTLAELLRRLRPRPRLLLGLLLVGVLSLASLAGVGLAGPAKVSKEPIDPETQREVMLDLPASQHLKNVRGKRGEGCCVWASSDMMARWMNFGPMIGVLQDRLGGGYPQLVDVTIARRAPGFRAYAQAEGAKSVELMDWAVRTGRIPCVTYGYSERMGRGPHMVILVHLDPAGGTTPRACVVDNNYPGTWEWMSREDFLTRHRTFGAWSYSLTISPPPPAPTIGG